MHSEQTQKEIRNLVRGLPSRRAPEEFRLILKINASKEASKRRKWAAMPALLGRAREAFLLWRQNMMRPLALPCAGGLTAAILVFTMFVETYPVRANSLASDTPTALYTEAKAKTLAPFEPPTADAEIEVVVDEQGRLADYWVVGETVQLKGELKASVERTLLFTEFTPATSFGQAVSSRVRISLRRGSSAITVKG
jgi:hypothetical protein